MPPNTITGCFAEQVRQRPDAVAVTGAGERLTYAELDERSDRLAARLHALGVGPEDPVAVLMERSVALVVAILATVKAGGCYLPLHADYPPDRLQWIMDRAGRPVLLADRVTAGRGLPRGGPVVLADEADPGTDADGPAPDVAVQPDQLAYVIHTSGSTGHPKGVAVTHRDVLDLALDPIWDSGRHERVLMIAPYAFNVSTYELWVPLLHGGTIVVAPPGIDVATLRRLLVAEGITGVHLTAGLFRVVAEEAPDALAGVREVLTGGDVIAPPAVRRVLETNPDLVVRGMYGATEGTLFSTHEPMTRGWTGPDGVPIGRPMDGVRLHVLDERLAEVPPGVAGELYLAGRGVARGYLDSADLTAERFVADPFGGPGDRMYRTGDMVRIEDGELRFAGRTSDQVKILGFRVELAEVQSVLERWPGLAHAVVVARESATGEKRLVAYVVPETEVDLGDLRAHTRNLLPEYMVPSAFVVLDALPLTTNGKLDRRALPEPDYDGQSTYRAPRTPAEQALCDLYIDVLGVSEVGIDDSFFDLSGQSLLAMRLISRIATELGVDVPISVLFDAPTVAGLAEHLESTAA
jgi:amino acid adenylation domain-containing protein